MHMRKIGINVLKSFTANNYTEINSNNLRICTCTFIKEGSVIFFPSQNIKDLKVNSKFNFRERYHRAKFLIISCPLS